MAKIISVISGKGGVGKTTTVSNLGAALVSKGKEVIVIDGNVTTPNLSLHLGIPFYPLTLHDVLKKKIPITSAIYEHPSGLKIIPASLSVDAMKGVSMEKMENALWSLLGSADIILVDSAAGLGREAMSSKINEIRSMLNSPILSVVPEDSAIPKSIHHKKPVVHHRPNSEASKAFFRLASMVAGEPVIERLEKERGWFDMLTSWFR